MTVICLRLRPRFCAFLFRSSERSLPFGLRVLWRRVLFFPLFLDLDDVESVSLPSELSILSISASLAWSAASRAAFFASFLSSCLRRRSVHVDGSRGSFRSSSWSSRVSASRSESGEIRDSCAAQDARAFVTFLFPVAASICVLRCSAKNPLGVNSSCCARRETSSLSQALSDSVCSSWS